MFRFVDNSGFHVGRRPYVLKVTDSNPVLRRFCFCHFQYKQLEYCLCFHVGDIKRDLYKLKDLTQNIENE